jgi:SAM-dependent methyltransferase
MEPKYFEGKIVMELGCGTAVASITASKMGAKQIYATDGNQEVVQLAQANLKRNGINVDQSKGNHLGEATSLRWGLMDAVDYYDTADIIIGSDLTYNSGAWGLLAETFEAVLKPDGIAIYLSLGHSGFSISGELGGFATVIESQGRLEILSEGSEGWPFQKVTSLDSLLKNSLSNKELDVVKTTGGFKTLVLRKKRRRRSR